MEEKINQMAVNALRAQEENKRFVSTKELVLFLLCGFFYSTITGMITNYRNSYIVNVLLATNEQTAIVNSVTSVINYLISFVLAIIIDRSRSKIGKFRPLGLLSAIPLAIFTVLNFYTPDFIAKSSSGVLVTYLCFTTIMYTAFMNLGATVNSVAVVMSPNNNERDDLLSWRGIVNAVGASAALVVVLVIGLFVKNNEGLLYLLSASLCAMVGAVFMLLGMKVVKERIVYSKEQGDPIKGFRIIIKNKHARAILFSEFLKNFRGIAQYMGIFIAAGLFGSTSKYIMFALPTGIGTAIGMLIVNALLKKFNSKQIYIASGIYSVVINTIAFVVGYAYFTHLDNIYLNITFFIFMFLIGLQFGASNLLPSIFSADVLEEIEADTGKRLDASLGFVTGLGSAVSGFIALTIAPMILYGEHSLIGYIQPINNVYQTQSTKTMLLMLGCYTIFHGLCMVLGSVPFFFYDLTGEKKAEVHNRVLERRASFEEENK